MKKLILSMLTAVLTLGAVSTEGAELESPYAEIELKVGSNQASYVLKGQSGTIDFGGETLYTDDNGKLMFPLRAVKDVFMDESIVIDWYSGSKTAVLRHDNSQNMFLMRVTADSDTSAVCGEETKMESKPVIKNNQLFVEFDYVVDAMTAEIIFEDNESVRIKADPNFYTVEELESASDILADNMSALEIKSIRPSYQLNCIDVCLYDTSTMDIEEMKELCGVYRIRVSYVVRGLKDVDD